MLTAALPFLMGMVAAHGVRVVGELAFQECLHLGVGVPGGSRIKGNSRFCKRSSGAAADAAANQGVHAAAE